MFITFIVVDNKVSEIRNWDTEVYAYYEFEKQKRITENFDYTLVKEEGADEETNMVKMSSYIKDNTICNIYMYKFPNYLYGLA